MSPAAYEFLSLDLPAMATGTLCALTCALLGNFLVLRRESLMGDAVSHAILPGLVIGFLITGSRATLPMFLGAAAAGAVTVGMVSLVRSLGRVEPGAAMGVVFSVMFALGVILIEQAAARGVDLDPDCVLNGQLERVFWFPPETWDGFFRWSTLGALPRELLTAAGMTVATVLFIAMFFKELRIAAFDPALATSLGFSARLLHAALMLAVAAAVVASFEAVGSILVIAMLVCPAATARLLTDRLGSQILASAAIALVIGIGGYLAAAQGPALFGGEFALSAAGMMAVAAGAILFSTIIASPRYGVVARAIRRARLSIDIAREDLLAELYRLEERPSAAPEPRTAAAWIRRRAAVSAVSRGEITGSGAAPRLTPTGRAAAAGIVRAHRLWETFLVDKVMLKPDHVHATATDLEHVTDTQLADALARSVASPASDPHGRPIPTGDGTRDVR